jgi:hypothetical protein
MSTRTIDKATRQNTSHLMTRAILRVASIAALSVLFALINCVAPGDQGLAAPALDARPPAVAQASTTAAADSNDHRVGAGTHTRRN